MPNYITPTTPSDSLTIINILTFLANVHMHTVVIIMSHLQNITQQIQ